MHVAQCVCLLHIVMSIERDCAEDEAADHGAKSKDEC